MKFDFTTVPERKGKDAIAVDIPALNGFEIDKTVKPGFDLIPMWVADMNFVVPACITDTVSERLEHPSFMNIMTASGAGMSCVMGPPISRKKR